MSNVNIFISFDMDHDRDLYDLLVEQSANGRLGFEVSGRSAKQDPRDPECLGLRRRIREADQMIVICGEHTDISNSVLTELRVAQEEQKPYFLLWGRRDKMCTKPTSAKASEGMYGWTSQILRDQITLTTRNAVWNARTSGMKRARKT